MTRGDGTQNVITGPIVNIGHEQWFHTRFLTGRRKGMGDNMTDSSTVFRFLLDNRFCPDDIPGHMDAGIYALFAGSPRCLPGVVQPQDGLLYIGQSGNLAGRNHFRMESTGFSSPRRSLGALLKSELQLVAEPRSTGRSPVNYRNYRFGGEGETRLSKWMKQNLMCANCPLDSDVQGMEKQFIKKCEPPLNLTGWRNPQKGTIRNLRAVCREEAKLVWSAFVASPSGLRPAATDP